MKYKRFEDLPVWQAAIDLADRVFRLVDERSFGGRGDLRNQLQRAATSVSNNIAEGFERGTTQELLTFLYYARGSAGEVRSMLHLCGRLPYFDYLKSEISDLKSLSESISRQIRAWADSLQNSDIKGQRYLSDGIRAECDHKRRAEAFWAELDRLRAGAAPGQPRV
ncbi:MAG: four helix bundle protein [Planctomycetes bacterium]|nr:four helix bundle protein [Planctomycetota bacterium]